MELSARELALHAIRLMDQKGGEDIQLLAIPAETGAMYDYMVLPPAAANASQYPGI